MFLSCRAVFAATRAAFLSLSALLDATRAAFLSCNALLDAIKAAFSSFNAVFDAVSAAIILISEKLVEMIKLFQIYCLKVLASFMIQSNTTYMHTKYIQEL